MTIKKLSAVFTNPKNFSWDSLYTFEHGEYKWVWMPNYNEHHLKEGRPPVLLVIGSLNYRLVSISEELAAELLEKYPFIPNNDE